MMKNCPKCKVSLKGDRIPRSKRHLYGATHFRREIGIEVRGVYDGVLYYVCPDCSHAWPREFAWERMAEFSRQWARKHNDNERRTKAVG